MIRVGRRVYVPPPILAALLVWVVVGACGSPSEDESTPRLTREEGLGIALRMVEPVHIWAGLYSEPADARVLATTFEVARELQGQPLSGSPGIAERRDEDVWFFVFDGDVRSTISPGPGETSGRVIQLDQISVIVVRSDGSASWVSAAAGNDRIDTKGFERIEIPDDIGS